MHKLPPYPPPYKSFAGAGTNKFVLKSDRLPVSAPSHLEPGLFVVAQREEVAEDVAEGEAEGAQSKSTEPFFVADAGCDSGIAIFGAVCIAAQEVDAFGIRASGGAAI